MLKKMTTKAVIAATALSTATLAVTPALADISASTTTELNLRAGPGPQYAVTEVMPAAAEVDVLGCMDAADWCKVRYAGTEGWAYNPYLAVAENQVIYQTRDSMDIAVVEPDGTEGTDTVAGGAFGAAAASLLVGGPAAVAAGAAVGMIAGNATPDETTVTYIQTNPVETVYLNGEVVTGAGIPEGVDIYEVPDSDYAYAYVNDEPVVVNPDNRRIVYIVR
jgi:uncharacterized protein YraI